jgi:hypothetical protein
MAMVTTHVVARPVVTIEARPVIVAGRLCHRRREGGEREQRGGEEAHDVLL